MAKKTQIEIPQSNLHLMGHKMDTNGNHVVLLGFPDNQAFAIQTLGTLKNTFSILKGAKKNLSGVSKDNIKKIGAEVTSYVEKYGSKNQKSRLKLYNESTITKNTLKKIIKEELIKILESREK